MAPRIDRNTNMTASGPVIRRRGAIAVVHRAGRLLVIRRSDQVVALGAYCFPGGGIEGEETETEALVRELQEELGVDIFPVRRLWRSVTDWSVELAWWLADFSADAEIRPAPAEVEQALWLTIEEIRVLPNLLSSNHQFLDALESGEISIEGLEA